MKQETKAFFIVVHIIFILIGLTGFLDAFPSTDKQEKDLAQASVSTTLLIGSAFNILLIGTVVE